MSNNAAFGITLQKLICEKYNITPHQKAIKQFESNYDEEYKEVLLPLIDSVFKNLGSEPIICLTYAPSNTPGERLSPHNFILSNGKTLSIRSSYGTNKVASRVIGQSGIQTFNTYFEHIAGHTVVDKEEIKQVVIDHIDEMLPIFLDYLFVSDYTVWIYKDNDETFAYDILDRNIIVNITAEKEHFSFTKGLNDWIESTTLKYNGISLAEIQIHKNRTFKFRFDMKKLMTFIKAQLNTTETFGISAETAICSLFGLEIPDSYQNRRAFKLENDLTPILIDAFKQIPHPIKSTGSETGARGKNSKASYDFILEGNKTLSLKTNTGKMVCPPEVGQPGAETCYLYFKHLTNATEINELTFKEMVFENIDKMIPIYIEHLFDSDYMLWIYQRKSEFHYKIFESDFAKNMLWDRNKFSFTKVSINEWNESNTLKYDGISIGEFQVHKGRSCYIFSKF